MSRMRIPVCGKRKEEGQSPLLRTAQFNIALEAERIEVKLIVAGSAIFVCRNCPRLTASHAQTISAIASNDQDCL
jgi:hypothetical protein